MRNPLGLDRQAMEGGGFYDRNSAMQALGIERLLSRWRAMCKAVESDGDRFVIVDYGSSQGRNSMAPMRIAIEETRRRIGDPAPIEVFHTDLPANDFATLFNVLESADGSYMSGLANVFPACIGRSYFQQLLPAGVVCLGWNTWSMQWLSSAAFLAPDHVLAGMSEVPSVKSAVKCQLAKDWRVFLQLRAVEMRPGAKFLCAFTGRTEIENGWEWLLGALWTTLLEMEAAGLLTNEELEQITIPIGFRSLEDVAAPFQESGVLQDLALDRVEVVKIGDPIWSDFENDRDAKLLAQRRSNALRAWAGPTMAAGLDRGHERRGLVDDIFTRFADRIAADPRQHEPYMAVAAFSKRARR